MPLRTRISPSSGSVLIKPPSVVKTSGRAGTPGLDSATERFRRPRQRFAELHSGRIERTGARGGVAAAAAFLSAAAFCSVAAFLSAAFFSAAVIRAAVAFCSAAAFFSAAVIRAAAAFCSAAALRAAMASGCALFRTRGVVAATFGAVRRVGSFLRRAWPMRRGVVTLAGRFIRR